MMGALGWIWGGAFAKNFPLPCSGSPCIRSDIHWSIPSQGDFFIECRAHVCFAANTRILGLDHSCKNNQNLIVELL